MGYLVRKTTGALLFSFVLLSLLAGAIFLNKVLLYFFLGGMLLFGLFCMAVPLTVSFAALISIVLGFGFFLVCYSWNNDWDIYRQGMEIGKHIVFSIGALSVWLLMYYFKKTQEQFMNLNTEVESLRKYDVTTGALKFNEFQERAKLLYSGMARRGERGFYVIFELQSEDAPFYKNRIILEKTVSLLLDILRKNYDLISKFENRKIIVFLTNTDRNGIDIVLSRFEQGSLKMNLNINMFDVYTKELPGDWQTFQEELQYLNRGLAS